MIIRNYTTESPFGKDEIGIIKIEFSREHYLPKSKVREVFGWNDESQVCDIFEKYSRQGLFVSIADQQAYYVDLGNKKSVISLLSCDVNQQRFKDLSWLEEKILATKKSQAPKS